LNKKNILRVLFFVLLVALIIFSIKKNYFTYDNILEVKRLILSYGLLGPAVIVLLFVVFNIFAFPTFFFIIISGYLYGFLYGFIIGWIGMTVGIASSFFNTRYLFKTDFHKKFGEKKSVVYLEKLIKKYHGWAVIFLRVFFIVPYNVQNITYGLTSINGIKYIICSALGILPITILFSYLGGLLGEESIKIRDINNISMWMMLGITVISALIFMTSYIVKKYFRKKENLK
jgi:uncharacterized membrane protein YdjX (TVP38/TMEM64 family)